MRLYLTGGQERQFWRSLEMRVPVVRLPQILLLSEISVNCDGPRRITSTSSFSDKPPPLIRR
jgi:hypothetical protein